MNKENQILFETIYKEHYPMVLQMCIGYMKGDVDQAYDLTQDVFVNTWNAIDSFKGNSSYKTWLYRITVNTCLQYIRKENKRKKVSVEKVMHTFSDDTHTSGFDKIQGLYKAIGILDKIDRLIIMMVLEGQNYDDISEVMGMKPTNLRVKIHRIKKKLKKIVDHG